MHVLVAFWLSVHAPGITEDPGAWLTPVVSGAPACIDAAGLQGRAEALLGPGVVPPPTRIELDPQRAPDDAWTVRLRIDTAGEIADRSLSGRDCTTLTDAIALVIAVHVDPLSVATRLSTRDEASALATPAVVVAPPSSAEDAAPAPVPARPPRTTPVRAPALRTPHPRERVAPGLTLGVAAMAELGVLPRAAGSFALELGVRWPHAAVELSGLVSVGPRITVPAAADVEGTFRLYAAAARGCGVVGRARVEAAICGGLEAGDLWGRATGLQFPDTVNALWLAPTLGVRPRIVLHPRIALGGIVDVLVPLRRHRFHVEDGVNVHTVAPIAARFGLSMQVRLR